MRFVFNLCITTTILMSCSSASNKVEDNNMKKILISWKSEYVMGMGPHMSGYYQNRDEFIKPYTSKSYSGDTLRVETLHEVNSCAETIGIIRFSNDSLALLTKIVSDEVCTSVEYHRFKYTIVKKGIKNYIIKY